MAHIISLTDEAIPEGDFYPDTVVTGSNFEECRMALEYTHAFANDLGVSQRVDSYIDANGDLQAQSVSLYTLVGGSIR